MSRLIDIPDYLQIAETFALELAESVKGKQTTIPFIRTPLPHRALVSKNELFQVFVIGGTNGESSLLQYTGETAFSILSHEKFVLPKFETADDFFRFLDSHIDSDIKAISLNFAFTLIPVSGSHGELDGIMMSGDTKGHAFVGLQKERVGLAVQRYFQQTGREILVSVANDTVCLLLSSLNERIDRDTLLAGVVGTGYNLAMFLDAHTAVNLQASDFSNFNQTDSGKIVDGESTNKGEQLYNKEVAAGELYKHFNVYIDLLNLTADKIASTEALDEIALHGSGASGQVARELFERSAFMVAAQLAGLYVFKGKPARLDCVMEGSLFWKGPNYRNMVEHALVEMGVPKRGTVFRSVADSTVLGAVRLVLSG